jgi:hypothetical protein
MSGAIHEVKVKGLARAMLSQKSHPLAVFFIQLTGHAEAVKPAGYRLPPDVRMVSKKNCVVIIYNVLCILYGP